jgi:hypothetical protein
MKHFFLWLFLVTPLWAQENCDPVPLVPVAISTLAQQNLAVTEQMFRNVLRFNVKMAGDGNISVLLNPQGNLEAIRLNYTNNDDKKSFVLDRAKLDRAERISLPGRPDEDDRPPLQFYPLKPPGLDFQRGGVFKVAIMTSQDPPRTEEYEVTLRKSGSDWIIDQNNRRIHTMTLHPGVSFLSWKGTFDRIEFR